MHHTVLASFFAGLAAAQGVLKASFTQYGSMDNNNSPTCNRTTVACGYWSAGYYAAISQNFYGGQTNSGAGYACEQCWLLNPQTDSAGKPLNGANSIVVKINDLCPVENNAPCAMQSQSDTNYLGANVNFDLCMDDGAAKALFPANGPFLALGQAQRVSCSQWLGQAPCYGNCTAFPGGPGSASSSPTSVSPPSQCTGGGAVATAYGQCGGQGWTGATCCPAGSSCQTQNQYYAQCVPASSAAATSSKVAAAGPSGTCSAPASAYSQCGGQGWTGSTCCKGGLTCQSQNAYYSQCLPPN